MGSKTSGKEGVRRAELRRVRPKQQEQEEEEEPSEGGEEEEEKSEEGVGYYRVVDRDTE